MLVTSSFIQSSVGSSSRGSSWRAEVSLSGLAKDVPILQPRPRVQLQLLLLRFVKKSLQLMLSGSSSPVYNWAIPGVVKTCSTGSHAHLICQIQAALLLNAKVGTVSSVANGTSPDEVFVTHQPPSIEAAHEKRTKTRCA